MLPNGFTRTALAASLLLGTSALALAQTHPAAPAPAPAPAAAGPATTAPDATQAEPQKAEPGRAATAKSSEAKPNEPGATKSSEVAGHGNSTVESTPNRASGHSDMTTSGSSTETGKTPANGAGGNGANASASASASATVNLTTTQKTEIHKTIINNNSAPRANNLSISLNVGVAVPPAVQFAPLPANVIAIEPSWRGYDYFLYGDQIVIIEPGTRRIVAILVG